MQKISSLLLTLIACAGTIFADGTKIDDLYYNLYADNKTAEVTSMPSGYYTGDVIIPASVEYNSSTYSVTSIGEWAFKYCSSLTSVTNYATTPQTINSYVFYNVDLSSCTLYVPEGSIGLYKAAEVWKDFTNIQAIDTEDIDQIQLNSTVKNHKILYNGKVYILTGDKTYTVTGQQLK